MGLHVFITGGAGFIGSRLAERFLREGANVTIYDILHPQVASICHANAKRLSSLGARIIEGDVRDASLLLNSLAEAAPDTVYHLAAETGTGQSWDIPAHYTDVNVTGTARLVEALRANVTVAERVILASSRAVYGEGACIDAEGNPAVAVPRKAADLATGDYDPKDHRGRSLTPVATDGSTCPVAPTSIYGATKLMQEYVLSQGLWGTGSAVGILRLQNVYGPGQALDNPYTGVLSIFARQVSEGKALEIYEDGRITRDFVYIDDVVESLFLMGVRPDMPPEILDIGSGEGSTILEVAATILELMGQPADLVRITGQFRPGDIRHAVADISRAKAMLGWTPRVGLRAGLENVIKQVQDAAPRENSQGTTT